ncbi:proline-rich receptor-like protein kinase PERK8 [Humulus lupulus]|uniref:proline-rich receptor-like protein kinase PERK8 n=1 Tax=Humulus lupulus TaxID=3486 RepID=UPI002B40C461|nr:proline-rich receptor-like protein kinase PERK8 [Humulus lupulus]
MTIREPSSTPRTAATPAPLGKGKQKASEHPKPTLESLNENGMPAKKAFDLYTNPASNKKSSQCHPGEGCSDLSAKRARMEDPPAPTPTKETTPPSTPVNQNPPAPVDQTPPAAPANITPPVSTDQTPSGHPEKAPGEALTNAGVLTMSSGWWSSRALVAQFEKRVNDQLSMVEENHVEHLKTIEAKHTEQLKEVEAKHAEALEIAEAKLVALEEELKKKEASITKSTALKSCTRRHR